MLLCSWVWMSAGVADHGVANPEDAVLISTVACLGVQYWPGCVWSVCGRVVGSVVVWSLPGGAGRFARLVCRWACPAPAGVGVVDLVSPGAAR